MKRLVLVFLLFGICSSHAENLKTRDGTVYENVTIIAADPEKMLIVHSGGGCQVEFENLSTGALSAAQQKAVEEGLRVYAERAAAQQLALVEKKAQQAFEKEQLAKGLIRFEGVWMKPGERQEIMAGRELDRLKVEKLRLELEQKRLELEKERQLAEQRDDKLEEYNRYRRVVYSYGWAPSYSYRKCRPKPVPYKNPHHSPCYRTPGGLNVSLSSHGSSVSYHGSSASVCGKSGISVSHRRSH